MDVPPILGVAGASKSGKTTLLERVIPLLLRRGLRVGAVKHCGHVDTDAGGKDSDRLAAVGAAPAAALGPRGTVIAAAEGGMELSDVAGVCCADCDLVLAEGFSRSPYDKLLVLGDPPRQREAAAVVATVGADLSADDPPGVAEWIAAWLQRRRRQRRGELLGVVLAGGQSRRMGRDKSRMRLNGRSVLRRLCELLADRAGAVMVVGRRPRGGEAPCFTRWAPDDEAGLGPLGGLATALRFSRAMEDASGRGVLVAGCDLPLLDGACLDWLLSQRRASRPATAARNGRTGRIEPLPAIYEAAALDSIRAALAGGQRSVTGWLESAGAHVAPAPDALCRRLANVNTPADLDAAGGTL